MKPGIRTTEFWTVLLTQLIGFLVLLGIITAQDQGVVVDSVTKIVTGLGTAIANALVVIKYIQSRTELKIPWVEIDEKDD
jgi:hypothetical protein